MIKINYPDITFNEGKNIDDKEVLYWVHRTNELKTILSEIFNSVIAIEHSTKITLGFIAPILDRQIELSNSIFVLMTKGRVRDSAILLLTLYELTLDIQYVSINPGLEKTWMEHTKQHSKPWRVMHQIEAIFTKKNECDGEKEMYKHFSMIKHGNYAANEFSFNMMVKDSKLKLVTLEAGMVVPNLRAVAFMFNRTFIATLGILKTLNVEFDDLQQKWEKSFNKLNSDFLKLLQIKVLEMQFKDDPVKQKELFNRLNLSFDF